MLKDFHNAYKRLKFLRLVEKALNIVCVGRSN